MAKGVSLLEGAQGGMLDNQDVTIVSSRTGEYTYPNSNTTINALIIQFKTEEGAEHTEGFSSGQSIPTDDGTGFDRKLDLKSKAKQFIDSMIALKYPGIDNDVRVFEGAKVHVYRKALPKMAGIDKEGDRDKTVLLVDKIIALPGKGGAARPTAPVKSAAAQSKPTTTTTSAMPASTANGEPTTLDLQIIDIIQGILAVVPNNTVQRLNLGTKVMMKVADHNKLDTEKKDQWSIVAMKSPSQNPAWLAQFAELGGWTTDGENVTLAGGE